MNRIPHVSNRTAARAAASAALFAYLVFFRTRGVSTTFPLLGDQIRDWTLALGRFRDLPWTGTPSSIGGTSLGPIFYWVLWGIRVTFGPWFDNLPHAGGIGLSVLQSAADVCLFLALWQRFRSVAFALAIVLILATAPFDVAITATIWNPTLAVALVKLTLALVMTRPPCASMWWTVSITATSWLAVQAHSSAVFVAAPIVIALVVVDVPGRSLLTIFQRLRAIAETVLLLQVPMLLQLIVRPEVNTRPTMVMSSVAATLTNPARLRVQESFDALTAATNYILATPWHVPALGFVLILCTAVSAWHFRHEWLLAASTAGVLVSTVVGFSAWQSRFDHYWYLPIMPAVGMTTAIAVAASPLGARFASVPLLALSLTLQPGRYHAALMTGRMPEYESLVKGAQQLRAVAPVLRDIRTDFKLPPTADPTFMYRILGGVITTDTTIVAVIGRGGQIRFIQGESP